MNPLLRKFIPLALNWTPRSFAEKKIQSEYQKSVDLFLSVDEDSRTQNISIPLMPGVDSDMKNWSLCQVLEHNALVNEIFTHIIECLLTNKKIRDIDAKNDVLPQVSSGSESLERFEQSVKTHQTKIKNFTNLRKGPKTKHPIFGEMKANQYHAFFGIHLSLHRKQMEKIVTTIKMGDQNGAR